MQVETTEIADVKILHPRKFGDERGFFSEVWNAQTFREAGIDVEFMQDNHAYNAEAGVVRGLHYQLEPKAQGKLVRVTRGAVLDVAVDILVGSPTFRRHIAIELWAEDSVQLWRTSGFVHRCCTIVPDTELLYRLPDLYTPENDCGIFCNEPAPDIQWPVCLEEAFLSVKDKTLPLLKHQRRLS